MRERVSVLAELFRFIWQQRAWWLIPIVVGLIVVGGIAVLGAATPIGPFIYPLF